MLKLMNKKQKTTTNKGFSLVELIVVIAIMAVLVAVLAPAMVRYVENSRKSTDAQTVAGVVSTVQAAVIDEGIGAGNYTITLTGTAVSGSSSCIVGPDGSAGKTAIEKALKDAYGDNWNKDIVLKSNTWGSSGNSVVVSINITNSGATTITYGSTQASGDESFADYTELPKTSSGDATPTT